MKGTSLDKPIFIVSLDLELAWGFISYPNHRILKILDSDPEQGRGTIDLLLKLFEKFNIAATWAVVGHLFLDQGGKKELLSKKMPQFQDGWLNRDFYNSLKGNSLYYGRDIVERILASPVEHEIGLHSFSHILFSRCRREIAEAEVEQGVRLVRKLGIIPKSFTFPEDYIGHVDVLKNYGFRIYRGGNAGRSNPETQNFLIRKANRAIDKIVAPPVLPLWKDGLWELPGSTYFCDRQMPFAVLPRAKIGLNRAIRSEKIFHISLHSWSLLLYKRLAKDLERFFVLVSQKREEGKLCVITMGGLASCLSSRIGELNKEVASKSQK